MAVLGVESRCLPIATDMASVPELVSTASCNGGRGGDVEDYKGCEEYGTTDDLTCSTFMHTYSGQLLLRGGYQTYLKSA
jgi:hypothetical protein